jgi:hypothetical protein
MAAEEYRAMARECYELARKTQDAVTRRELILLAAKWTELAELNEKPDPLAPDVGLRTIF